MKRTEGQDGFTLLEAMVALVLLALVLAPAYTLLSGGGRAARTVERRAMALSIAEAQLAALGVEQNLAPGEYQGEGGGYRWTLSVTPRSDPPFDGAAARGMAAYRVAVSVSDQAGPVLDLASTRLVAAP
ncbi:prepilin-type N-terminal cleavage/methylation domain-containing protein [Niveispirillum sp. KHB5.9]|uniref:prepilin-type N-terminal cleavage/methylation domain-containing protein n=1 Tax=Niveispirillum sp. KHB5.9 TaxID=3400269 RepID=UPI003A8BA1A3